MSRGGLHPDRGDGPPCPEPGDHGRTYQVFGFGGAGEYWWCPVTQELFEVTDHGHGIGRGLRVRVEVDVDDLTNPDTILAAWEKEFLDGND